MCTAGPAASQIRPSSSSRIPSNAPVVALGEDLAAAQAVAVDVEDAEVAAARGVGDVQQRLVEREREPVRPVEVVGDDRAAAGRRVDPVDVASADLALGLVALVVTVDPVRRGRVNQTEPSE